MPSVVSAALFFQNSIVVVSKTLQQNARPVPQEAWIELLNLFEETIADLSSNVDPIVLFETNLSEIKKEEENICIVK